MGPSSEISNKNIELIESMKPFKKLKESGINDFLKLSEIKEYKAGDLILEEGSYDERVYYLISGKIKIIKDKKTVLTLQNTGDIFGEMGAIEGMVRSASIYAVYDTSCIAIDISDLDDFDEKNKYAIRYVIYREFAEVLAHRLRQTTDELMKTKEILAEMDIANQLIEKHAELAQANNEIKKLRTKLLMPKNT